MSFIRNIRSVAVYESKILLRSWFFRIFSLMALFFLTVFNAVVLFGDDGGNWPFKAIASNLPYVSLLLLNTGQAVIAIFLASDFVKRDRKLDTSEVFYVRPLSNGEYVFGKIWGNLRVFILLNLVVMGMVCLFTLISPEVTTEWKSFLLYFLIICVPTLVYIIGLSIFLMSVLKNQALTFVILLGYIGLTVFYIGSKFYFVFDYMAYSLPLMKSSIVGMVNYETVLIHRAIYLFAGLAFICFTVVLFSRLPNNRRSNYGWIFTGICFLALTIGCAYKHVDTILGIESRRALYVEVNNTYAGTPRMVIDRYDLSVAQEPGRLTVDARLTGVALEASPSFTFCLNPGLEVTGVGEGGQVASFTRDHQILRVDFGRTVEKGDSLTFTIRYGGVVDDSFCYLDIADEVIQLENRDELLNIAKKYCFQQDNYVLLIPEAYWYPRPGTGYSDRNPDWLQTYFSRFDLRVKTLPGLQALSQGEGVEEADGSLAFSAGYPMQGASLIIGDYQRKQIVVDSTQYNLWYIDGHDYFSAELDTIRDTIPALIRDFRQNLERTFKLEYPFSRFSVVEVPAPFFSYARAWTQAQETMQPEMVLFPEKAWLYNEADVRKRWKDHIRWAGYSDRSMDESEAKVQVFNDVIGLFRREEGRRQFSEGERGRTRITTNANPIYVFPQFYNFRYNIFSPQWTVANRVVELYLQEKQDNAGWEREVNGISNNEKASLLLENHTFKELLSKSDYIDIMDNMISLEAADLFAEAEIDRGVLAFRDSVYSVLSRNTFRNIRFETLLDTLENISGAAITSRLERWAKPHPLPYYTIRNTEVAHVTNKGMEHYVLSLTVANESAIDGIVQVTIQVGSGRDQLPDPKTKRKISIAAGQSRKLVSVWDEMPREVQISTLISKNLPNLLTFPIRNVIEQKGQAVAAEGDFIVPPFTPNLAEEVIVDNEDTLLFSLSKPAVYGLLPQWLDKVEETPFAYAGVSPWRPPLQWTATTNSGYYGTHTRSAYVIRKGDGSQWAKWKVPVPSPGYYGVYYWPFNAEMRGDRRRDNAEYHFKVEYGNETEDAYMELKRSDEDWVQIGMYYFDTDTIVVTLTNKCELRTITADAVRIVKRQ